MSVLKRPGKRLFIHPCGDDEGDDSDEENGDDDDMSWLGEWSEGNGFIGHTLSPDSLASHLPLI